MTRLTEADLGALLRDLESFEDGLREVAGFGLRDVALRTATDDDRCIPLYGARLAAVPVSSGLGFIPGFSQCVAAILQHLGCEAWVTVAPDVRGIQEALGDGAQAVFLADDHRFVVLDMASGRCVDNDLATADGYVTALDAAAGGVIDRDVLVLGLGPVGRAACRRLVSRGAVVHVVEPDADRREAFLAAGVKVTPVDLDEGLARCDLVYDATPAADFIDAAQLRETTVAAVPGIPSGFTPEARRALGLRHIHEPLAVGVAVMAARALL